MERRAGPSLGIFDEFMTRFNSTIPRAWEFLADNSLRRLPEHEDGDDYDDRREGLGKRTALLRQTCGEPHAEQAARDSAQHENAGHAPIH